MSHLADKDLATDIVDTDIFWFDSDGSAASYYVTWLTIAGKINALIGVHNHDGVYEPIFTHNTGFNLDLGVGAGQVAEGNHNHDAAYSAIGHNHDATYSLLTHDHDGAYAALSHTHTLNQLSDVYNVAPAVGHVLVYDDVDGRYENRLLLEADISDLQSYELADATILKDADIGVNIEAFVAKNTAWNKNFGTGSGQVAEGDHNHDSDYATAAQGALADSALQSSDIDTLAELNAIIGDATLLSDSAIAALIDTAVTGLYDHKGAYNASTNSPDLDTSPSGIMKGDAYTVSVAGTFYAVAVEAGDVLIADQDDPTASTHWTIVNRNIDSSAFEPADATILKDADIGVNVEAFVAKNTAWNKDFGTGSGEVAEGDHDHSGVYEPADATIVKDADIGSTVEGFAAAVSQAEAEAGTVTSKRTWTPERVKQAIVALAPGGGSGAFPASFTTQSGTSFTAAVGGAYRITNTAGCAPTLPATFAVTDAPIFMYFAVDVQGYSYVTPASGDSIIVAGVDLGADSYFYTMPQSLWAFYPVVANTTWLAVRVSSEGSVNQWNNRVCDGAKSNSYCASCSQFDLLYHLKGANYSGVADADSASTMPVVAIALASVTADYLMVGLPGTYIYNASWSWTPGDILYASTTAGGITATPPSGAGDIVQVIGYAETDQTIYFNPSPDWFEVT